MQHAASNNIDDQNDKEKYELEDLRQIYDDDDDF